MITTRAPQKQSAPAEVEGSTRATPCDVRGDGYPLRSTYDGPASLANVREVVYVALDSGQSFTQLLKRSEIPPTRYPGPRDVREARVLAFDADASPAENAEYAKLVANCLIANRQSKTVPVLVMRAMMSENQRQAERIRTLEERVAHLERDNEQLYKLSRR